MPSAVILIADGTEEMELYVLEPSLHQIEPLSSSWINLTVPSPTTPSYAAVSRSSPHSFQTSRQARGVSRTVLVHLLQKAPEE